MNGRFETFTVLIAKINRSIRRIKSQEMAEYDLKSSHVSCIYYIYSSGTLTATELCERSEEDKATVSRALDYLEKNEYIVRDTSSGRRYKSTLSLTEKGREVGDKLTFKIDSMLNEVGTRLSESEREEMYRCLTIVSDSLDAIGSR